MKGLSLAGKMRAAIIAATRRAGCKPSIGGSIRTVAAIYSLPINEV